MNNDNRPPACLSELWCDQKHVYKLELFRAHTPRAACACIWELQEQHRSTCMFVALWRPLPTYARRVVRMSRKHMVCSSLIWVGAVDRRGQQKSSIFDARGPCQWNWSILKPVFRRFRRIHCNYESLRCLHLEIWRFSCRRQTTTTTDDDDRQNRLLYPLRMRAG